mmetsp:Transcript_20902/g.70781  ORF Transcript_20902/g.70781 Transcript_20902/m.70781 type:complete len:223 (+) Transcript_20902:613-1281(+)
MAARGRSTPSKFESSRNAAASFSAAASRLVQKPSLVSSTDERSVRMNPKRRRSLPAKSARLTSASVAATRPARSLAAGRLRRWALQASPAASSASSSRSAASILSRTFAKSASISSARASAGCDGAAPAPAVSSELAQQPLRCWSAASRSARTPWYAPSSHPAARILRAAVANAAACECAPSARRSAARRAATASFDSCTNNSSADADVVYRPSTYSVALKL